MTEERTGSTATEPRGVTASVLMRVMCERCPHLREDHPDGATCNACLCSEFEWPDRVEVAASPSVTEPETPAATGKLRALLDESRPGPWTPEGEADYDEDKQVVWLTNEGQDSLRLDASDVALLLNAALRAEAAAPPQEREGIDVERLALALEPVTRPLYAGEDVGQWRRTTAKKIAAEYARLSAASEPGASE